MAALGYWLHTQTHEPVLYFQSLHKLYLLCKMIDSRQPEFTQSAVFICEVYFLKHKVIADEKSKSPTQMEYTVPPLAATKHFK